MTTREHAAGLQIDPAAAQPDPARQPSAPSPVYQGFERIQDAHPLGATAPAKPEREKPLPPRYPGLHPLDHEPAQVRLQHA